ncbi:MAG: hypothetical protein QXT73_07360, partial [Candidatus Methanomethylicaceae archaeon]
QMVSYKIMVWKEPSKFWVKISIISIIFLGTLFIPFTCYAPYLSIFQDPISGGMGYRVSFLNIMRLKLHLKVFLHYLRQDFLIA